MQPNRQLTGPRVLDGIRVLDFTSVIAGPYCTRLMTDMGAEVLKVEPPGGEFARHVPPMRQGVSAVYSQLNCGKKSLSLDLKHATAADIIKQLVGTYDVVVENFSPGVMARLELDYSTLTQANPALIMCSISGYGQTGPGAQRPAYAPVVQAESGYEQVYLQYQPGLERPLNMGPPVADTTASLQALGAINAALFYRLRTGQGQHIDIAMFDALINTFPKEFQQHYWPSTPDRLYGPFDTLDGFCSRPAPQSEALRKSCHLHATPGPAGRLPFCHHNRATGQLPGIYGHTRGLAETAVERTGFGDARSRPYPMRQISYSGRSR